VDKIPQFDSIVRRAGGALEFRAFAAPNRLSGEGVVKSSGLRPTTSIFLSSKASNSPQRGCRTCCHTFTRDGPLIRPSWPRKNDSSSSASATTGTRPACRFVILNTHKKSFLMIFSLSRPKWKSYPVLCNCPCCDF
jgi:hypothetical protein